MSCVSESLHAFAEASFKVHQHPCPHCGCAVRYPVAARQSDIEDFRRLMETCYYVMDKYDITANLLAEIVATAQIRAAMIATRNDQVKP